MLADDAAMQCTLLIPRLWWSRDAAAEAYRDLAVPALETLCARATHHAFPPIGWEAWLCQAFEVERQRDWPIAPITLTQDGGDPQDAYWMRADPVHLRAHRHQLLLADSSAFDISQGEADILTQALNAHFDSEAFRFRAPSPERWYLRLDSLPQIGTTMLDDVAGTSIDPCLPKGPDALHWHRIMNEIQMLFHENPVNEAREARGELPINGVWLWGGGRSTAVRGRHFSNVTSDEPLASALAERADIPTAVLPADGRTWLDAGHDAERGPSALVVLNSLTAPARRGDVNGWRNALAELETRWIAPLLAALKKGRFQELVLVAPGNSGCARFELTRSQLFRFWRARRPLASYLALEHQT
ncbi:MAG: phosphoglycerate mutase [Betaproteobacteria bacterium]